MLIITGSLTYEVIEKMKRGNDVMRKDNNKIGITFRINTANKDEKKLYDHLMDKDHSECSMSAYVKSILFQHFETEDKQKILQDTYNELILSQKKALNNVVKIVNKEMKNHDARIMAVLASGQNTVTIDSKERNLEENKIQPTKGGDVEL